MFFVFSVISTGCYQSNERELEGAAAPYIIQADKAMKKVEKQAWAIPPTKNKISERFFADLLCKNEKEEKLRNPLAIDVNTTSNGSMTQSVFYDYCEHFVQSLPPDQGKDGLPCILILDGHVSTWNLAAL